MSLSRAPFPLSTATRSDPSGGSTHEFRERDRSVSPNGSRTHDKGKAPSAHVEEYFTAKFESELHRVKQSLGEVRGGAKLFERRGKQIVLPSNWQQMVEQNNIWLLAERCMEINGFTHVYDESSVSIDVSQKNSDARFCDGLLLATAESNISQTNWATTSEIERGRLEGTVRRAVHAAARSKVPWNLMRQAKAPVVATLTYVDTLYLRLSSMFKTQTYHQTVAMFVTKLFNAAMFKIADKESYDIREFVLSFDEVWTQLGDIKKDSSGRPKMDRSGNPKRYHPSRPDFNGMEKTEVLYIKEQLSVIWEGVNDVRQQWREIDDPSNYAHCVALLRKLYNAQVKSVKGVKALADERVSALGLPKNTTKTAIANRKAQRIATDDYKPVFAQTDLRVIGVSAQLEFYSSMDKYFDEIGLSDKEEIRSNVRSLAAEAATLRQKLLSRPPVPPKGNK